MKDSWWATIPVLIDADCPGGVVATVPVRLDVVATDPVLFPFLGVGNRSCPLWQPLWQLFLVWQLMWQLFLSLWLLWQPFLVWQLMWQPFLSFGWCGNRCGSCSWCGNCSCPFGCCGNRCGHRSWCGN